MSIYPQKPVWEKLKMAPVISRLRGCIAVSAGFPPMIVRTIFIVAYAGNAEQSQCVVSMSESNMLGT